MTSQRKNYMNFLDCTKDENAFRNRAFVFTGLQTLQLVITNIIQKQDFNGKTSFENISNLDDVVEKIAETSIDTDSLNEVERQIHRTITGLSDNYGVPELVLFMKVASDINDLIENDFLPSIEKEEEEENPLAKVFDELTRE